MTKLTLQQVFNKAITGFRNQGYRKAMDEANIVCKYKTSEGLKCLIGHCIPDELYTPELEGKGIRSLLKQGEPNMLKLFSTRDIEALARLQKIHDSEVDNKSVTAEYWEKKFQEYAEEYSLTYAPPTNLPQTN